MDYTLIKYLHILSASLLFGTGLGSAFYKWRTDKSHDLGAVVTTNKNVVLADWLFTTPTVVIQPLSGVWLAQRQGYSWSESWLLLAIMLFIFAGICWLIVVYLQIRMRDVSVYALTNHTELPAVYKHLVLVGHNGFLLHHCSLCLDGIQTFVSSRLKDSK